VASTANWAPTSVQYLYQSTAVNSLVETADIHCNGQTLTIGSGGIIFETNNFWMQDSSGTLTSGLASGELFVHCPNAGLSDTEIRVAVTNNGSTPVSLIKDGPGTLIMQSENAASNSYTGNTIINGGALRLLNGYVNVGELGGTPNIIVNAGGTLQLDAQDVLGYTNGKEALTINSGGAVSNITAANRVTIQNLITMTGGVLTGTGTGDGYGVYSFNNDGAGILATSDSAGNPSVISTNISPQNTNLLFTVNRGPANPPSDLNVTGYIQPFNGNTNGIALAGNGVMTLSGSNTYTGGTTISGGTLVVGGGGVLGNGAYAGAITDNSALVVNSSSAQLLSGVISGSGSLTDKGAGILALTTATNTYSNGTTIIGDQLELGNGANENASGLGTGPVAISSGGTLHMMPGSTANVYDIANSFTLNGATVIGEDGVQHLGTGAGATVNIGPSGAVVEATWSGKDVYIDGALTGSGALALAHGPTGGQAAIVHITNGANTFNGTVSVSGAGNGVTLDLDNNTALQFATVNLNPGAAGAMLLTQTGVSTVAGLTGTAGTVGPTAVAGAYTLDVNAAANAAYGGTLVNNTGTLALALTGSGRLTLSNNGNTYSGGTTIGSGTLQVGNGGASGAMGTSGVADNGTLVFNLSNTGAGVTFNNAISGSGNVLQAGSGYVVLSGGNSYGGGTTVSAGTLQLANRSALGAASGSLVVSGVGEPRCERRRVGHQRQQSRAGRRDPHFGKHREQRRRRHVQRRFVLRQ
jgi:autotransporter-associated beta strand protein